MPLARLFQERLSLALIAGALAVNSILWILLAFKLPEKETILLRYNVLSGGGIVSPRGTAFMLPVAGLAILFLNTTLANVLASRERTLSFLLLTAAFACGAILLLAGGLLVAVNT